MRGAQAINWSATDVAESYALWWRDAGLHVATSDTPHGFRGERAPETALAAPPRAAIAETAEPVLATPILPASTSTMPGDLAEFLDWLSQDTTQPDGAWGGQAWLPPAVTDARLLVITDMPDDGAGDGTMPLAGSGARLLRAMLGAIGLPVAEVAFAPLAMRRAPGGLLDEMTARALASRMRHYLGLARPRAALILGDRTSRALLGPSGVAGAGDLPEIEHNSGTLRVAALPAPELLMRRPLAKAASWQTLRLLNGAISR